MNYFNHPALQYDYENSDFLSKIGIKLFPFKTYLKKLGWSKLNLTLWKNNHGNIMTYKELKKFYGKN